MKITCKTGVDGAAATLRYYKKMLSIARNLEIYSCIPFRVTLYVTISVKQFNITTVILYTCYPAIIRLKAFKVKNIHVCFTLVAHDQILSFNFELLHHLFLGNKEITSFT